MAVTTILNYAIGTGILNLPHTIAACSIGISAILLIIVSFSSYLVGQYALDGISRQHALERILK